jgi:hypothetical protein
MLVSERMFLTAAHCDVKPDNFLIPMKALSNLKELATGLIEVLLDEGKEVPRSDATGKGGVLTHRQKSSKEGLF